MNSVLAKDKSKAKAKTANNKFYYDTKDCVEHSNVSTIIDCDENSTILDLSLLAKTEYRSSAYQLYCLLATFAGNHSKFASVSVDTLAYYFNRTTRTVKKWLKFLTEKGIIEQKSTSLFIIHDGYRDSLEG